MPGLKVKRTLKASQNVSFVWSGNSYPHGSLCKWPARRKVYPAPPEQFPWEEQRRQRWTLGERYPPGLQNEYHGIESIMVSGCQWSVIHSGQMWLITAISGHITLSKLKAEDHVHFSGAFILHTRHHGIISSNKSKDRAGQLYSSECPQHGGT